MSAKPWAYRESRMREGKTVNWSFVRNCLRYRQEVRDLKRDGFEECRSWTKQPFEGAKWDKRVIAETRIADGGTSLWVRMVEA